MRGLSKRFLQTGFHPNEYDQASDLLTKVEVVSIVERNVPAARRLRYLVCGGRAIEPDLSIRKENAASSRVHPCAV